MNEIQPQHLRLAELLTLRLFRIPDYQRSYSWTSRQRRDLFGDLRTVFEGAPEASHFMATVVCLRRGVRTLGTDFYTDVDVVDGQQRLTTLIILLKALQLALAASDSEDERAEADGLDGLLVKRGGGELLLLQTNQDSSYYFADYIRKGTSTAADEAKTIADRELLTAVDECEKFVADWRAAGSALTDLVRLLKNRLSLVIFEISEERQVYTVFEVLNSRGLEVSWLDRLKSILMGAACDLPSGSEELIDELHHIWRNVYTTVGLRQGMSTEALRFAATLWGSEGYRPLGEQASVDLLRQWAHSADGIRDVSRWLLRVTRAHDRVLSNDRVGGVTRIAQARLLAVAIYLMDVDAEERSSLLACWERVCFRIYGMYGKDSRTLVGDFVRLARRCVAPNTTAEDVETDILRMGDGYPIEDAVEWLRGANCYEGWQEELRYLMCRYEEHLAEEASFNFSNEHWNKIWTSSASKSIEHIWAQSSAPEDVRHNLGNLMMLPPGLNAQLGDKPFPEKKGPYKNTGLLAAQEVAATTGRWLKPAIRARETKLLKWVAQEWAS